MGHSCEASVIEGRRIAAAILENDSVSRFLIESIIGPPTACAAEEPLWNSPYTVEEEVRFYVRYVLAGEELPAVLLEHDSACFAAWLTSCKDMVAELRYQGEIVTGDRLLKYEYFCVVYHQGYA